MAAKRADFDQAIENPAPASTALVLSNPGDVPDAMGKGKGIKGYVNMALPLVKTGALVGGGFIASNVVRTKVSLPLSETLFGKDKVTPGKAFGLDWVIQLALAIAAYKGLGKKYGGHLIAGGIIASQVVSTVKFMLPPKPGQTPSILQQSLDVLTFTPSGGGAPASGIMPPRQRQLNGIMPRYSRA